MNPLLGRWISADPLAVHSPADADLNLYAYVHGRVLSNTDPLGLTDGQGSGAGTSTSDPAFDDLNTPQENFQYMRAAGEAKNTGPDGVCYVHSADAKAAWDKAEANINVQVNALLSDASVSWRFQRSQRQPEIRMPELPQMRMGWGERVGASTVTTVLTPANVTYLATTGDTEGFAKLQLLGLNVTVTLGTLQAPRVQLQNTKATVESAQPSSSPTPQVRSVGTPYYPPNDGFVGVPRATTLQPGARIDRFGGPHGRFAGQVGDSLPSRALPPDNDLSQYNAYEVLRPLPVRGGTIAPWFGQPGGGTQYVLPRSIRSLTQGENPYLRRMPNAPVPSE